MKTPYLFTELEEEDEAARREQLQHQRASRQRAQRYFDEKPGNARFVIELLKQKGPMSSQCLMMEGVNLHENQTFHGCQMEEAAEALGEVLQTAGHILSVAYGLWLLGKVWKWQIDEEFCVFGLRGIHKREDWLRKNEVRVAG